MYTNKYREGVQAIRSESYSRLYINRKELNSRKITLTIAVIAILLFTVLSASVYAAQPVKIFQMHVLDVGQGDCIFIVFPNGKTMLVDAGDGKKSNNGHIERYIKRFFKNSEPVIDVFVSTHPHADHIGGAANIIRKYKTEAVWDSGYNSGSNIQKNYLQAIRSRKVKYHKSQAGEYANIGGTVVRVLGPVKKGRGANNNSIVLHITYGSTSFLLTGDMEHAERKSIGNMPHADVYKAAHHGSHTGTDAELLKMLTPKYVIFSYKTGNSYGHPHDEVVKLCEQFGITRFDTPSGDIIITSNGADIKISQAKEVM